MSWHPILKKQFERSQVNLEQLSPELSLLFEKINNTYNEQDLARYRLTNSLKISSDEMARLYKELQIQSQQKVLESKLSTLGEMAAGLAHEINNPLAILDMNIQLLDALRTETDFDKMIPDMTNTLERIKKIVHGLKTYSRNAELDPIAPFNLREIIDDTLSLFQHKIKKQKINFLFNFDENTIVNCRPSQISQIILNIIMNAADAMEKISDQWIEFRISEDDQFSYLKIIDNGPGIPKEVVPKLLEPFFTTKELGKGTGLGLSISKRIMEEHNGEFYYDPSEKHTCFVLKFNKKLDNK